MIVRIYRLKWSIVRENSQRSLPSNVAFGWAIADSSRSHVTNCVAVSQRFKEFSFRCSASHFYFSQHDEIRDIALRRSSQRPCHGQTETCTEENAFEHGC